MRFLSNACRLLRQTLHTCLIRFCPPLQCFPFAVNLHVGNWHNRKVEVRTFQLNITATWCYWIVKIEYQLVWRYHWRYGCVLPRFNTNPPINSQNDRGWSQGKKSDVMASRLLVQRTKFAPHIMVSAGVPFEENSRLLGTLCRRIGKD